MTFASGTREVETGPAANPQPSAAMSPLTGILVGGAALFEVVALVFAARSNVLRINPDALAYLLQARHVASRQLSLSLNGFRSPLLSWLMAPLLAAGIGPLWTSRCVMALSGAVFFAGAVFLFRSIGPSAIAVALGAWIAAFVSIAWSVYEITPDLLAAGIVCLAIGLQGSPRWPQRRATQYMAGAAWGFAYLAKAVYLPVAAAAGAGLACAWILSRKATRGRVLGAMGRSLLGLVVIAGPWIFAISVQYGHPTISTAAGAAHAFDGPPGVDRRNPAILAFRRPPPGRLLPTEDSTALPFQKWSPFDSPEHAAFQLQFIGRNAVIARRILEQFDQWRLGAYAIAGLMVLLVIERRALLSQRWSWTIVPLLTIIGIYLPVFMNSERYFFVALPLLFVLAAGISDHLARRIGANQATRVAVSGIVALSFLIPAQKELAAALPGIRDRACEVSLDLAARLRAAHVAGPIAGTAPLGTGLCAPYIAFFLDVPWYGDKPDATPEEYRASGARLVIVNRASSHVVAGLDRASGFVDLNATLFRDPREAAACPIRVFEIQKK